jgi:hypothetical protein
MKTTIAAAAALFSTFLSVSASADDADRAESDLLRPVTMAVIGDWPYSQFLLDNYNLLVNSVNADARVGLLMHVGDIHSGSMPCTSAGILPAIATANPGWNQAVFHAFQQFKVPVVYTPGDNEWADCHKSKQLSSGDPLKELASVRSLFFAKPGTTLGRREKKVWSQAEYFSSAFPSDAQFVENVMWMNSRVVFVTLNIPGGSNNDTAAWSAPFTNGAAQALEVSERDSANLHWLQDAFDVARDEHARAVVVGIQADLWDAEVLPSNLGKYAPFVAKLAELSLSFGRPVLLLNGDTHLYHYDQPMADPNSVTGKIYNTPAVPNLTRIVVQGSLPSVGPSEWLRLTIDPRSAKVFSWDNVVYCTNPLTSSCQ